MGGGSGGSGEEEGHTGFLDSGISPITLVLLGPCNFGDLKTTPPTPCQQQEIVLFQHNFVADLTRQAVEECISEVWTTEKGSHFQGGRLLVGGCSLEPAPALRSGPGPVVPAAWCWGAYLRMLSPASPVCLTWMLIVCVSLSSRRANEVVLGQGFSTEPAT